MGIYTDSHGNTYSINIGDPELQMISNNPDFHFCWMNDNDSIRDTKSNYYVGAVIATIDSSQNISNRRRILNYK